MHVIGVRVWRLVLLPSTRAPSFTHIYTHARFARRYYHCEICGDETYRGQRDYEKHFGENKHSYGMKCLGIPNSKHFHGITKVDDARALWKKIQGEDLLHPGSAAVGGGGDSSGEQFEDRDGNVMSKEAYEGLARQGLL